MSPTLLLFLAFGLVYARPQDQFCGSTANYTVLGTGGTFGCQGYANSVTVVFNVSDPSPRILTFLSFNTEACCDKVTIQYQGNTLGPFSGTINPGAYAFGGGDILVIFKTDPSGTAPGFSIQVGVAPPMDSLKSQQPLQKTLSTDGFSYFVLQNTQFGSSLAVSLTVNSFNGLQSPTLFISQNSLPSLESYAFMNNTVAVSGGRYVATANFVNPPNGQYCLGVFLYGNNAAITLNAVWNYNFPRLVNGVKNSSSVVTGALNFQLYTPKLTKSLTLQISRQVPGGFPIAYIAQGYLPTAAQHGWVMDTTVNSYISLTINSPNPTVNYNPNPGLYVISIVAATSETDIKAQETTVHTLSLEKEGVQVSDDKKVALGLSAGFIFLATWS